MAGTDAWTARDECHPFVLVFFREVTDYEFSFKWKMVKGKMSKNETLFTSIYLSVGGDKNFECFNWTLWVRKNYQKTFKRFFILVFDIR